MSHDLYKVHLLGLENQQSDKCVGSRQLDLRHHLGDSHHNWHTTSWPSQNWNVLRCWLILKRGHWSWNGTNYSTCRHTKLLVSTYTDQMYQWFKHPVHQQFHICGQLCHFFSPHHTWNGTVHVMLQSLAKCIWFNNLSREYSTQSQEEEFNS